MAESFGSRPRVRTCIFLGKMISLRLRDVIFCEVKLGLVCARSWPASVSGGMSAVQFGFRPHIPHWVRTGFGRFRLALGAATHTHIHTYIY